MIPLRDKNRSRTFPAVTIALIIVNALLFIYETRLGEEQLQALLLQYGIIPSRIQAALSGDAAQTGGAIASLFTSMFLHGGWLHLIMNMWYLWIFGDNIEDRMGHMRYLLFYLLCGVLAGVAHVAMNMSSGIPTVGASGAIAGVLGAYLVLFPRARVLTLVPIFFVVTFIEIPAMVLLGLWFLMQLLSQTLSMGVEGSVQSVAFMAHIGGFIAGMLLVKLMVKRTV